MSRKCSGLMCTGCTSYGICDREIDPTGAFMQAQTMLAEAGLENPERQDSVERKAKHGLS